jgi:hypothetical protein
MGGGLLEWRWGRTANQQTGGGGNKKEKSATRKKSTRRVRFKEGSSGALRIGDGGGSGAAPGGVVQGKEKKRVWFSRIWLSIRRKEGRGARRQTAPEKGGIELPSEYSDIVFISVSKLPRSSSFTRV